MDGAGIMAATSPGGGGTKIESIMTKELIVSDLRAGIYTATPAADSTGYILVKDSTGTEYKIMVQA